MGNNFERVEFARDVLGFHNSKGGVIIVGVTKHYKLVGVPKGQLIETNVLHQKLRDYIGSTVSLFQEMISVPNERVLWLIFIPRRDGAPIPVQRNGPDFKPGQPVIKKGDYYIRVADEVKLCREPNDFERLFTGVSMGHLQAYLYDVDDLYFRLLAPHCDSFIGRRELIMEVTEALNSRQPIVILDGLGGVGKSAIAIQLVRELYGSGRNVRRSKYRWGPRET